ncbi:hypothetical protein [Streptomyces pratensis]|uniref:hypothetical protein n=1 Tax=Streptomyces pratensis TaxID=1169025 RepID=UPI001934A688|nr:hypothetical protein [Streptomyces pratensis]
MVADEWLSEWTDVPGVEGVAVKSLTGRYRPGARGWSRVRRRNSTEALVGAVTGFLPAPGFCRWAAKTPPAAYGWWARQPC